MRWGLGPVFIYECLANSRRWQTWRIAIRGRHRALARDGNERDVKHGNDRGTRGETTRTLARGISSP